MTTTPDNTSTLPVLLGHGAFADSAGWNGYIDPAQFHDALANDLPVDETRLMAATQCPVAALAFSEQTRNPAWRQLPSWAVVPMGDRPPAATSCARWPSA